MGRISKSFEKLKSDGRKAFVGYVMVGYPDLETSQKLAAGLLEAGADALELGMPFSDPMADGPVIQECSEEALKKGATLDDVFATAAKLRERFEQPLLVMSYLNPVLATGETLFIEKSLHAGVDGVIIPDLPPDEAEGLAAFCKAADYALIFLAAPTSDNSRLKKIAKVAGGFIYMVSVTGVTGERDSFDSELGDAMARLRKATSLPAVIGFGVSNPENATKAAGMADGVVVASAVLRVLKEQGLDAALQKAKSLIEAVKSV